MRTLGILCCLSLAPLIRADGPAKAERVEVVKLWDRAPHCAFTDLTRFNKRWFCVFREGKGHVSPDGAIRVLTSADGKAWTSAALITSKTADLRDPKITVTPDGKLHLSAAAALHDTSKHRHQTLAWFSADGKDWGEPVEVGDPGYWLWRITWQGKAAYGVGYETGKVRDTRLYSSPDGKRFTPLVSPFVSESYPNEHALTFQPDGSCLCLLRRDGTAKTGLLGSSKAPYKEWTWKDLGVRIGGPSLIRLPDGRLLAVVRLYQPKARTAVCAVDPVAGKLTEILALPSGGDTSYAGLVWHDDQLWISYYSSHEKKTSIYLARVRLPMVPRTGAIDLGSRRELFVDGHLIERLTGTSLRMERPRDEGNVLKFDKPWEGPFAGYVTILRDGERLRAYYRGMPTARGDGSKVEVTCVAESKDGKAWTKPERGLFEVHGTRANNVILAEQPPYSHNFAPMLDTRPGVPAEERYKALAGISRSGLAAFVSADGLRWKKVAERVITGGAFDSQNVPFWSEAEGCYLCYFRVFVNRVRQVARTTSKDFRTWTEPVLMTHGDAPVQHLYTNQTHPYFRAPHLYVGLAARFMPGRQVLDAEQAKAIGVHPSYFRDCSDAVLLTSRGGSRYDRTFLEGFLTPGIGAENWVSRTNYPAQGVIQTGPAEMSFYANQNYGQPTAHLRRYALRLDGFACVEAPYRGGEMLTRPFTFAGKHLVVNFATSAAGGIRIEIQDADGKPVPGYSLAESVETIGNEIDRVVRWKGSQDVSALAGKPIRLRFVMSDGRLYALRFRP